jgi:PAS domain S-box-containing protein
MPENEKSFAGRSPNRIIVWILTPVICVGVLFGLLFIRFTTPALKGHITGQIDSNLRLASELGLEACENRFNYLIELRLENDASMNAALKREALAEIKSLNRAFHNIHMLVLESGQHIVGSSQALAQTTIAGFDRAPQTTAITPLKIGDRDLHIHHRYFPFWDWQIVSYIEDQDYFSPVALVQRSISIGTLGVLLLLTVTLTIVFRKFVARPLKQLSDATRNVAEGRYQPLAEKGSQEIVQLIRAFNQMTARLETRDRDVQRLLQELGQTEERFRTLFESAPIGFALVDQAGQLLEANSAMNRLLGLHEGGNEAVPNFRDCFQQRAAADKLFDELARRTVLSKSECDLVRPDGSHWNARLTASAFALAGEPVILMIAEDASRERKLEGQLQRARKMEAIGTLAGGVAHDLNNILSAVVGYPEMLLMDLPPDSPQKESLLAIKHSGDKAALIVQDLLTLARRGVSVSEVVNLNSIVADYRQGSEYGRLQANHPGIRLESQLVDDLMNIKGSPVHLSKTLMNLVANAAEAMPAGGRISVVTQNRYVDYPIGHYDAVPEGDYAVLTVADGGTGISKEDLEHIFEPFFTRKKMGQSGTGLGMAVVWGTVKDHRGYIDVQSEVGRGTTFTLYFPVTREEIPEAVPSQSLAELSGRGETVLVVDDIEAQRRIAADMLGRLGYQVETAASGEEAVKRVRTNPPDLVVLDMVMAPGIDGLETYRRMIQINPGQKGIITSGFSETQRVREAQALGAGVYVKKPFTIKTLAEALKKVTGEDRARPVS